MKKLTIILLFILVTLCYAYTQPGERVPASADDAKVLQAKAAADLGIPAEKTITPAEGVTMELVLIPAGQFHMGSSQTEAKRDEDEGPIHQVKISKPFYMGKYEVTQQQYQALLGVNEKVGFEGPQLPVENVEWSQAIMFCNLTGKNVGTKLHLPTEAQWEYACRAGTDTEFSTGHNISPDQANYKTDKSYQGSPTQPPYKRTVNVGSYAPNAFGLYDMHGNVEEWCMDVYNSKFYRYSPESDPANTQDKGQMIVRGGSWKDSPHQLRAANRSKHYPSTKRRSLGFRVVMEIE